MEDKVSMRDRTMRPYHGYNGNSPKYKSRGLSFIQTIEFDFSKKKTLKSTKNSYELPLLETLFPFEVWEVFSFLRL